LDTLIRALNTGLILGRSSPAPWVEVTTIRRMFCSPITVRMALVTSVMNMGGLTGLAQGLSEARELFSAVITAALPWAAPGPTMSRPHRRFATHCPCSPRYATPIRTGRWSTGLSR
jgi:hypothetical protein